MSADIKQAMPADEVEANTELLLAAVNAFESNRELIRELGEALEKQQAYLNYLRREVPVERFNIDDQAKTVNAALAKVREAGL